MKKKSVLVCGMLLLLLLVSSAASQELRLAIGPGVLERLAAQGSDFYLEWSTYRNT